MDTPRPLWREFLDFAPALAILAFFGAMFRLMGSDWRPIFAFSGATLLLTLIPWAIATFLRRTGRISSTPPLPPAQPPRDPEKRRLPRAAALPSSGLARVLVITIRLTELMLLLGIAMIAISWGALPVFFPIVIPAVFLLCAGMESIAQAITRRHRRRRLTSG